MVLLLDRIARARVIEALRPVCGVAFVEQIGELLARIAAAPVSLVIVECRDRDRAPTIPAVETIRRGYPSVPIIVYACPGHTPSSEILATAHAGAHELILQGFDDFGITLRTVAESALRNCAATRVMDALADDLTPDVAPFVRYCLERSWEKPSVGGAAAYLGVNRKTIVYRTERDLDMAPSTLIGWCRLFLAAHLLEDPSRSVAQVALALDFGSSAALRGMIGRYLGVRPQELRARGGLCAVLAAFRSALPRRSREQSIEERLFAASGAGAALEGMGAPA